MSDGNPIPREETLTVEFKSDRHKLSDRDLIEALVCFANGEGGTLYLGVEDDGTPTGLHRDHLKLEGLPALIANRTSPALSVRVTPIETGTGLVASIQVPKARQVVATIDGTIKRRRLNAQGRPECVPLLPHEIPSRLSDLGSLDPSARPVPGATIEDLDPAERARLRQFIERFGGDRALDELDDEQLDGALGLSAREGGVVVPTVTGLLLIGKEASLRRLVPTHEIAFQVLDGEEVRVNEFLRAPLLRAFEWLDNSFTPLNPQSEVQVGLFRVPIPRLDRRAFREAVANALAHRDYARMGAVHVRLERDALVVSNPGGFVEGVTQQNLLTTEPRPRNPTLADALKRVGLVERTGRGVDLIYRGLLRYGRARPDYGRTTSETVVLRMPASGADLGFLRMVLEAEERRGSALPIDSLIALSCLREQRRLSTEELAAAIQKDVGPARTTLEALVEAGLAEPQGRARGRTYTLAARLYTMLGEQTEYTRQSGFDDIQQEQMVLKFVAQHGSMRRPDVVRLCQLSDDQATRLLQKMVREGRLQAQGLRRWTRYSLPD